MASNSKKLGLIQFPLSEDFAGTIRTVADPLQGIIIDLLTAGLTAELEDSLTAIEATFDNAISFDGYVVKEQIDFPASSYLSAQEQIGFPLLSVYRETWTDDYYIIGQRRRTSVWKVIYILPSLSFYDSVRIRPLLTSIGAAVMAIIEDNGHPNYQDGYQAFDSNFNVVNAVGGSTGNWALADTVDGMGFNFPTVTVTLESQELLTDSSTYSVCEAFGADVALEGLEDMAEIEVTS